MKTNKKIPDDLDYLSELGFEKMKLSGTDVDDIHKRIDKKVEARFPFGGVIGITISIGLLAVLAWFLLGKQGGSELTSESLPVADSSLENEHNNRKIIPSAADTVFPVLKVKVKHPVYPGEHFTQENTDLHFDPELNAEVLPSRQITNIEMKNAPDKLILEMLPNAPVIYIYDLKVTDFQKLYFKKNDPFTIRNGGLRAEYENIYGYNAGKGLKEPVHTADQVLKDGLAAFNKEKYENAISCFAVLLDLNKRDVNALFYSGLSQYHLNKPVLALAMLNRVLENENNVFHQEAEWYKALALIKNNDPESAKTVLLQINSNHGFYSERAGEKLRELQ